MRYGDAGRAPDVETVVTSHNQVIETHQPLHRLAVATADHDHRDALGQPLHRLAHCDRDHSLLWPVADRGQGPVVVQEYYRSLSGKALAQRLGFLERVLPGIAFGFHQGCPVWRSVAEISWVGLRPAETSPTRACTSMASRLETTI